MQNAMLLSNDIVRLFEKYRMMPTAIDEFEQTGKQVFVDKVHDFVKNNQVIEFVMLGFPFKSTNVRDKVISDVPDLGEKMSIDTFKSFTSEINAIYATGAKISIMSDGLIFNDVLEVRDQIVHAYKEICMDLAKGVSFDILDLNDFYTRGSLDSKRSMLMGEFGINYEQLQERILFDADTNHLYSGMIRFMREELAMKSFPSSNQLQIAAKKLTKEMMLRNEAYSNLVRKLYQKAIRLSMHPSVNNGSKFSFQMIPNTNHSAWHSAIAIDGTNVTSMHKRDAIANGYELAFANGLNYYVR
jgi:pyoverdine/dityrosine biosynthesis protein Dit1